MSRVDEVRAELGEDNVNELMDAYYTSGLSLNDLRELYDLPKSFADEKIVELFPMIKLNDGCPSAAERSLPLGLAGASRTSRRTRTTRVRSSAQIAVKPDSKQCESSKSLSGRTGCVAHSQESRRSSNGPSAIPIASRARYSRS